MSEQQQAIIMVLREFEQLTLDHVQTAQAIDALYQSQLTAAQAEIERLKGELDIINALLGKDDNISHGITTA